MKTILKFAFSILILSAGTCLAAPPEPKTRAEVEEMVTRLWVAKAYKELDDLESALGATDKVTQSGFSLLEMFHQAVYGQLESDSTDPAQWKATEAIALGWTEFAPRSALAHTTYANVHRAHALAIRGTGPASSVSPAQWRGFREYMAKSRAYLVGKRDVASLSPAWHLAMMRIAQWTASPEIEYRALTDEALDKFPHFFGLYAAGVDHYSPKWGGTPGAVPAFIARSTSRLPGPSKDEVYARLYNYAFQEHSDVSVRLSVECARWLRGGDSIVTRFRTPYNIHQAAVAAYVCQNRALAQRYFKEIGESPLPGVWGYGEEAVSEFRRARSWAFEGLTK